MLQKDLLLEHKTVLGNIILPSIKKKIPKEEAASTALKLLDEFKLGSMPTFIPMRWVGDAATGGAIENLSSGSFCLPVRWSF